MNCQTTTLELPSEATWRTTGLSDLVNWIFFITCKIQRSFYNSFPLHIGTNWSGSLTIILWMMFHNDKHMSELFCWYFLWLTIISITPYNYLEFCELDLIDFKASIDVCDFSEKALSWGKKRKLSTNYIRALFPYFKMMISTGYWVVPRQFRYVDPFNFDLIAEIDFLNFFLCLSPFSHSNKSL